MADTQVVTTALQPLEQHNAVVTCLTDRDVIDENRRFWRLGKYFERRNGQLHSHRAMDRLPARMNGRRKLAGKDLDRWRPLVWILLQSVSDREFKGG